MQPLTTRARIVKIVFTASLIVTLVALISDFLYVNILQEISQGTVDHERAEWIDALQMRMGLIQIVLAIAGAVVFLMWFHRAYKNLSEGGYHETQYSPGWAVGGFFVPFLNLVRPFQIMKEIWEGSNFLAHDEESSPIESSTPLIGWWWGLYITTALLGNASARMSVGADDTAAYIAAGWVTLVSDAVDIPATIVAIVLIDRVTVIQERARLRLIEREKNPSFSPHIPEA